MKDTRELKCWTCDKTTIHYILPDGEKIYECGRCGGLRKVDGTPSLGEMMGLPKGKFA